MIDITFPPRKARCPIPNADTASNRRSKLSTPFRRVLAALFFFPVWTLAADSKPNIVLIISDDQGWTDYGFMGHPHIRTPRLDRLAGESRVYPRGYVASPLCRPSLATMATGLYPFDHGVTGNDVFGYDNRAARDVAVQKAFHSHSSIIKLVTSNGYLAHQSGKWWEGSWKDGGFTHGMTHGDPARRGRHGDEGLAIGREGMGPITDFIDGAVDSDKPFFIWYAPFLPHTPHNPPQRLLERYTVAGRSPDVAKYYAMCEWFDETCGELIDYLDTKGIRENTLILYIADNGWRAASENSQDPKQTDWKPYALRSKGSPFEFGIRTPIMLSWLGHIEPGLDMNLAHAIDLYPTIAAATGLRAPERLPGINLLDLDAAANRDTVFGVTHSIQDITLGNPDRNLQYLWCVSGDWKALLRYRGEDTTRYATTHDWDTESSRLYNLRNDPHESRNLAVHNPEVMDALAEKIHAWRAVDPGQRFTQD